MTKIPPVFDKIIMRLSTKFCQLSEEGIFALDANFAYIQANESFIEMMGFERSELLGKLLGSYQADFVPITTLKLVKKSIRRLPPNHVYRKEVLVMTRYGLKIPLSFSFWHIIVDKESYYVGLVRDMSLEQRDQKKIQHLQNYSQVTNLPNRQFFLRHLSDLLLGSEHKIAVLRLCVDSYRLLVSGLGQDTVDNVMRHFVKRITDLNFHGLQCFAHFGGEDYAMLFDVQDANMLRKQLDKLMQLCEMPFSVNGHTLYLHMSVGVSNFPGNEQPMNVLISNAENALEYVKNQGGDEVFWFDPKLNYNHLLEIQLESDLRNAFEESQFIAYYQPKVNLKDGSIVGFEALVRWLHPTRGLLTPNAFIAAIITHKLSFELFFQMAEQVMILLAHWQKLGLQAHLGLNADAADFSKQNFCAGIDDLLHAYNIAPEKLHIEITESSLMLRQKSIIDQLDAIKALGVSLALDDFGTGYASLSYLQEFPFDFIKVDKSFVDNITTQPTQQHIVRAIKTLGNALNMQIVAEGIETREQQQVLTSIGCEYGQGYLFGKPMTAVQATELLKLQAAKATNS